MLRLLKMALCAVVLTTSVLSAAEGVTPGTVTPGTVTLWVDLPSGSSPLTARQIEREIQTIVEPSGLHLEWLRLPGQAGKVVDGASIVVHFRGSCAPAWDAAGHRQAAGWAHVADGKILPFIEVDCDQVWAVIEADLGNESNFQREFHLGRALARVLAHELHHVLSNTLEHGSEGLTRPRLASRDLISGSYTLSQADLTRSVRPADEAVASVTVSSPPAPARSSGYTPAASSFAPSDAGR